VNRVQLIKEILEIRSWL